MLPGLVHAERLSVGGHLAAQRAGHPAVADMATLYVIDHGVLHPRREGAVRAAVPAAQHKFHRFRLDDGVNFFEAEPLQF